MAIFNSYVWHNQRVNVWFMTFKSPTICQGSWAVENPTGDARYWGPASWLRFLHGPHAAWLHQGGLQRPETVAASGAGSLNNLEAPFDISFSGKRHQGSNHSLFNRYFKVYHMYTVDIYYTAYLRMIHMEVSWNGGTPKSSILMIFPL